MAFNIGDEVVRKDDGTKGEIKEIEILEGEPSYAVQWDDEDELEWHWAEDLIEP